MLPFVSRGAVLELRTSLFAALLPPSCEDCPGYHCDEPYGISTKGEDCAADAPEAVISWPACPWRWGALWSEGGEELYPDEVCRWLVDLGRHRDRHLPAGGNALLREYTRLRELPRRLLEAGAIEKERQKLEQGGKP